MPRVYLTEEQVFNRATAGIQTLSEAKLFTELLWRTILEERRKSRDLKRAEVARRRVAGTLPPRDKTDRYLWFAAMRRLADAPLEVWRFFIPAAHGILVEKAARAQAKGRRERSRPDYPDRAKVYGATRLAKRHGRLRYNCVMRIRKALAKERNGAHCVKAFGTEALLGCTVPELVRHLESSFEPEMSWENYGVWKVGTPMRWHIDHIRPCASFDLTDPEQQKQCFHWSNLRPLWAIENLQKRAEWAA